MHGVRESSIDGRASVVLVSPAGLAATFVPGAGMVAAPLTLVGLGLLGQRESLLACAHDVLEATLPSRALRGAVGTCSSCWRVVQQFAVGGQVERWRVRTGR